MPTPDIQLIVNGRRYGGWKSARVTRSIESLCGSFSLDVSERWNGQTDPWPIDKGDACRVAIGDQTVVDGFVTGRKIDVTATSRSLSYSGRDRAADLVDCSMLVEGGSVTGHKWTYRNVDIAAFARAIAQPHGINVSVQAGLVLKPDPRLVAHPGETGFEAIRRAAGSAEVLVVSDGAGGITITRAGATRAAPLTEGDNIESGSLASDEADRFHRYLIATQIPGTDEASGDATRIQAEATDVDVLRTNRVIVIRPDKGYNKADAKRRADWEARTRAAKSETVMIGVVGWTQPNGVLWPINALVTLTAPRMLGIKGDMLISQVDYTIADGGQVTQLHLVRPDAFTPEPQAVTSGEGLWLVSRGGDLVEPGSASQLGKNIVKKN